MYFVQVLEKDPDISRFVSEHKNKNIFQSFELYSIYKDSRNHFPFCYSIKSENSILLGVIFGVIQQYYFWPVKKFTTRAIISGGPLLLNNDPDVLAYSLKSMNKALLGKCLLIEFRNFWDWGDLKSIFIECGYKYSDHLNILIDLDQPEDTVIKRINKNKRRNVTKSQNKGTKVRIIEDTNDFDLAVKLLKKTHKRISVPFPDKTLFYSAFKELNCNDMLKVFIAETEGRIIGVRIELIYGDTIYDWYAGSDPDFNNFYPNDLLIFYILKWGRTKYKTFDFGGAGKPGIPYTVRDYKSNFGGKMIQNGRFEFVQKSNLVKLIKLIFQFKRKINDIIRF